MYHFDMKMMQNVMAEQLLAFHHSYNRPIRPYSEINGKSAYACWEHWLL